MLKSFNRRLEELEALEAEHDPAQYRTRIFEGFADVRDWLAGTAAAPDPLRVQQIIRLERGGLYNRVLRNVDYAEVLYEIIVSCVLMRGDWPDDRDDEDAVMDALEADPVCATWERNAALCWAVAEQGEPVTFRGETGSLIGLMCGLPSERPRVPEGVTMEDGRFIPLGGEHGELCGGMGEPFYLLMPDGERRPWPPPT